VLKIDKSFIDTIHLSDKNLSLAQSIISIGHTLGLSLIAEGVEDSQQLKILQELKCDQIQGYLISKPLSLNDLIKFIHEKTS
jgi:EAL domain-containing protein (putative c-di-GMP-specific phosphodiesterase class I)